MQLDRVYTKVWIRQSIEVAESVLALRRIHESMSTVAKRFAERGMPPVEIAESVNLWHDLLIRRTLDFTLQELQHRGLGSPPAPFCWLLLGSAGRMEQTLSPDQDNALVYRSTTVDEAGRTQERAFFQQLGELAAARLDEVGYPFCSGFVMAANERWNGSLEAWREQLQAYADLPNWTNARYLMIAADMRPLYGDEKLAHELRGWFLEQVPKQEFLQWQIADHGLSHKVGLDFRDRFRIELWGEHQEQMNIKETGYLQAVNSVRLWAMAFGIDETSTLLRISRLVERNVWTEVEANRVREALGTLVGLRLWGNYIHPGHLSEQETLWLKHALKTVKSLQKRTAKHFKKPK